MGNALHRQIVPANRYRRLPPAAPKVHANVCMQEIKSRQLRKAADRKSALSIGCKLKIRELRSATNRTSNSYEVLQTEK